MGVLEAVNKKQGSFKESDATILSSLRHMPRSRSITPAFFRARQQALEKVRVMNEIKNNFLAIASHELRTPLGIIMGYAGFLQDGMHGDPKDHAGHVLAAATRMRALLDEMKNLTLLQTDEMDLNKLKLPHPEYLKFRAGSGSNTPRLGGPFSLVLAFQRGIHLCEC